MMTVLVLLLESLWFYTILAIAFAPYQYTTLIPFSFILPLMAGTKYILGT